MGRAGKCCCRCDCLEQAELPNISINGMTGSSWVASTCCWTKTFTFNTQPAASTTCLPSHSVQSYETTLEADVYIMNKKTPPLFTSEQDFPLPLEYCCDSGATLIGTATASCSGTLEAKLRISYRPKKILVRASRQLVECGEQSTCKLVLSTSYIYEYGFFEMLELGSAYEHAVETIEGSTCFEQTSNPLSLCSGDVSVPPEDFDCDTTVPLISEFSFNRVKVYDEWPTGNVLIDNTAIPESGCQIELCNEQDYDNQVCLTATGEGCSFDCIPGTLVEQTWRPINQCDGLQQQYVYSGCDTELPTVVSFTDNEPDSRLCDELTRTAIEFELDSECSADLERCFFVPQVGGLLTVASTETNPPYFPAGSLADCIAAKDPAPTGCYYVDPCGSQAFGWPRFGEKFMDVTTYEYNQTCSNTTQSLCINAPTWTIAFA
jgi:hypothetical protein